MQKTSIVEDITKPIEQSATTDGPKKFMKLIFKLHFK